MRFPIASAGFASCAVLLAMAQVTGCGLDGAGTGPSSGLLPGDSGVLGSDDATIGFTVDAGPTPSNDAGGGGLGSEDATVSSDASDAADANPPVMPPPPVNDACTGTTEICNNGIDDNCDGKIDCADPQCGAAGWQCTHAAVPQGWTVVEYANAPMASSCGTGYTPAASVYEGPFGGASCTCSCSVATAGSCESGSLSVVQSDATMKCVGIAGPQPANNGACETIALPVGYSPGVGAHQQITPAPYTAGTCQPSGNTTRPAIGQEGHVCTESAASGAGCSSSGACVPGPQAGYGLCVQHDGAVACPSGFANAHSVGSGVTDTRGCSQCTCTGPTAQCVNGLVTLFEDAQCGDGGTATIVANGQCNAVTDSANAGTTPAFHAYEYFAQVSGEQCGAGTSTPNGAVALTGPSTICCQ